MALSFRPLTDSFALAWKHDPALDSAREDFDHAYKVACETGDWKALAVEGQRLTLFHFRPIDARLLRRLLDVEAGGPVIAELAFRMALTKIEDGDESPKIEKRPDPVYANLGPLVTADVMRAIDSVSLAMGHIAGAVTMALGDLVLSRSMGAGPLSERG